MKLYQRFLKAVRQYGRTHYVKNDEGEEFKKGDAVLVNIAEPIPSYLPKNTETEQKTYWLHVRLATPGSRQIIASDHLGTAIVAHPNQVHHVMANEAHRFEDMIPRNLANALNAQNPL